MAIVNIRDYVLPNKKYYIYGTTGLGMFFYKEISALYGKEYVLGFLETKPIGWKYCEKPVFSPEEIKKCGKDISIIIASATYFQEMKNKLVVCGFAEKQIVIPYKIFWRFKTLRGLETENIQKVCFWPPINNYNPNLIKKIAWYVPNRIRISIWCDDERMKKDYNKNVYFEKIANRDSVFEESEVIFLWNMHSNEAEFEKYNFKVYIVDPEFYFCVEILNYWLLYYKSFSNYERKQYEKKSLHLFNELKKKYTGCSKARIFCSGPSIGEIIENVYEDSINIICNSMVKDKNVLRRISPHILVYADPAFYLSPTEYCKKFYEDVMESQKLYDYYIFVPDLNVPLLLYHYPELSGRIIGIRWDTSVLEYSFPSESQLRVKVTGNILTGMLIPLASALCDEIEIAGCTGHGNNENFENAEWKYYGRMQYLDLMSTVTEMYPSIFRDQKYDGYYERHCQCVEELLEYGEEKGKKYRNITTSYIPALAKRTIHEN